MDQATIFYFLPSSQLTTTISVSYSWAFAGVCGRLRKDFQSGLTQDIKMGSCVFQCDIPHKWITQDRSAPCLYTVTEWGVMSCVCSMAFLCGSTLVKVPLLQAGIIAIWPQMFKSDIEIKQTKCFNDHKESNNKLQVILFYFINIWQHLTV